MIHDALLVLWDCSGPPKIPESGLVDQSEVEIFNRICNIAKSHHKIKVFAESFSFKTRKILAEKAQDTHGLYAQALSEGIEDVLSDYIETLVNTEGLVIENEKHTLAFVYSQVKKYTRLFSMLNKIVATIKERRLRGCQILSLVHQNILNGNEAVREAVLTMFSHINKVFVNQLCSWLLYGEIKDPYHEFFIYKVQKEETDSNETAVTSPSIVERSETTFHEAMYDGGCAINTQLIPYFIPLSLAQEILFIGKTIIIFGFDPRTVKKSSLLPTSKIFTLGRLGNPDTKRFSIWDEKEAQFHDRLQKLKNPDAFEAYELKMSIKEIKECVTKHLWVVTVEEAGLLHELRLMKDFYLLGRGELFMELLRLTAGSLNQPNTKLSTRNMNQAFQLAARAVLLSNSSDLEKFSFELPYVKHSMASNSSYDNSDYTSDGWSTIIMKYNFKWPLHLLFTPEVLARYNDMFRLLLRIKKTQHDLHALWKTYKQRSFAMCQLHNKLMFIMDNLQHYLQADVLETNFSRMMEAISRTCDFEDLKRAHATFLTDILSQSFLTVSHSPDDSDETDMINNPVFGNIMDLLKLCHSFCSMGDTVVDAQTEAYHLNSFSTRFNTVVEQLLYVLASLRTQPCGAYLARLLMRLDYNRWLSRTARLTQSVTNMLN